MKVTMIGHLEKLSKTMEHYYDDIQAPTNKQNWIIAPFAVTNLPELPLRVAVKFTEVTAEPANQISFHSFKKITQKYQRIFSFGFQFIQLIRRGQYV